MNVLAIIPARAGSKGVKDKNIREINGKMLIDYTVEAALRSTKLTTIVLSTDYKVLLNRCWNDRVMVYRRPPELATDNASVVDVALGILSNFAIFGYTTPDAVMLLQPTSPMRTGADIDAAITELEEHPDAQGVISVTKCEDDHPARTYFFTMDGFINPFIPFAEQLRRQELAPVYHRNGCIYVVRRDVLLHAKTFMPTSKIGYIMPPESAVNIDTEMDMKIAEVMLKGWKP